MSTGNLMRKCGIDVTKVDAAPSDPSDPSAPLIWDIPNHGDLVWGFTIIMAERPSRVSTIRLVGGGQALTQFSPNAAGFTKRTHRGYKITVTFPSPYPMMAAAFSTLRVEFTNPPRPRSAIEYYVRVGLMLPELRDQYMLHDSQHIVWPSTQMTIVQTSADRRVGFGLEWQNNVRALKISTDRVCGSPEVEPLIITKIQMSICGGVACFDDTDADVFRDDETSDTCVIDLGIGIRFARVGHVEFSFELNRVATFDDRIMIEQIFDVMICFTDGLVGVLNEPRPRFDAMYIGCDDVPLITDQ